MTHPFLRPLARLLHATRSSLAAFRANRTGIAAVEFAMLAPVLVIAFIGTFELAEAITVNRKVSHATSTVGDLITQSETLSSTDVENIFDATEAVMSPYPASSLKIVIATVEADENGNPKVVDSKARNTSSWPTGTTPPVTIPDGIDYTSQQVVIAKSEYAYTAVFGSLAKEIIGQDSFTLSDTFFLRPRNSDTITFN